MKNFIPDGTFDIVVLGPMDLSQPKETRNSIRIARAVNAVLGRPEFIELMKQAGFLSGLAVAPDDFGHMQLINGVLQNLENADLAIVDVTPRPGETQPTANVMYELGLTHAVGLPYLLAQQDAPGASLPPFYLNQTRVIRVDYANASALEEWVAGELREFLDPANRRDFAENDVSEFFNGAPLIDISAASGVAVGYYDNFVVRLIGEPSGVLADPRYASFKKVLCVLPEHLPNTKDQDGESLDDVLRQAGIELKTAVFQPLPGTKDRPLSVKHVDDIIVDIPTTLYPLRRSPRLVRQRRQALHGPSERQKADERKMQARLIQQFARMLRYLVDQDQSENRVRSSALHFAMLPEVVQTINRLRGPAAVPPP